MGVGFHGMSLAVVACIFSLVGFESATALGGEAKKPLRNVPRAVMWSLILTGLFFVLMSYLEVLRHASRQHVFGLHRSAAERDIRNLWRELFQNPAVVGRHDQLLLALAVLLERRIAHHLPDGTASGIPRRLGRARATNGTPHAAITVYIAIMFLVPTLLAINTNPLTIFGDAGTLAAFGFLLAYFLISIASPTYLAKRRELRTRNVVVAALAFLCLLVPTVGSFYPVPPYPINIFPYIFVSYMVIGAIWLFAVSRRRRGILGEIETDLSNTLHTREGRAQRDGLALDTGAAHPTDDPPFGLITGTVE